MPSKRQKASCSSIKVTQALPLPDLTEEEASEDTQVLNPVDITAEEEISDTEAVEDTTQINVPKDIIDATNRVGDQLRYIAEVLSDIVYMQTCDAVEKASVPITLSESLGGLNSSLVKRKLASIGTVTTQFPSQLHSLEVGSLTNPTCSTKPTPPSLIPSGLTASKISSIIKLRSPPK